jgi:putative sterol carrier protein
VSHQFLSDEWFTAVDAVYEAHGGPPTIGHKIKMNQIVTGAPWADEVRIYMDSADGIMKINKGSIDDAEVTVTVDYDTAKAILVEGNPQAGMQAFMAGKIKIQGDMTKLMAMQANQPDERSRKMADEIRALTT